MFSELCAGQGKGFPLLGWSSCFLPPRITSRSVHAVPGVCSLAACCSWVRKRWPGQEARAAQACVCVCLPVHDLLWVSAPYCPARCWKTWKLLAGVLRCPWVQPMMQQECLQHPKLTSSRREEAGGWGSWWLCPSVPGAAIWVLWGPASSG